MTNYERVTETLATAEPGFEMANSDNGRIVRVRNTESHMYSCLDHRQGVYYWTSSEDEAYRWLSGELFADLKGRIFAQEGLKFEIDDKAREKLRKWREQLAKM